MCPAGIYGAYLLCAACSFAAFGIPFSLPGGGALFALCAGGFTLCGGSCALGWLLRREKGRIPLALLAIPAGAALLTAGMIAEARLFMAPEVDSFDSLYASVSGEELDRMYYDAGKNVMVLDGTEYPPERVPNPDAAHGAGQWLRAAFEAVNPWSGVGLATVRQFEECTVPGWVTPLYLLKGAVWIALPLLLRRRTERNA